MRLSLSIVGAALLASSVSAATVVISVGPTGLVFAPNSTTANVGDILEFQFYPRNHSVVQGSFSTPCLPGTGSGFYSGFVPSSAGEAAQVFRVMVNDTNPIWYYCSQNTARHCQSGMVGVVNPPANSAMTFQAYVNASSMVLGSASQPAFVQGGMLAANAAASSSASMASSSMMASSSKSVSSSMAMTSNMAGVTSTMAASTTTATAAPIKTSGADALAAVNWREMAGLTGLVAAVASFMV